MRDGLKHSSPAREVTDILNLEPIARFAGEWQDGINALAIALSAKPIVVSLLRI